jgi:hypothetical protein
MSVITWKTREIVMGFNDNKSVAFTVCQVGEKYLVLLLCRTKIKMRKTRF